MVHPQTSDTCSQSTFFRIPTRTMHARNRRTFPYAILEQDILSLARHKGAIFFAHPPTPGEGAVVKSPTMVSKQEPRVAPCVITMLTHLSVGVPRMLWELLFSVTFVTFFLQTENVLEFIYDL